MSLGIQCHGSCAALRSGVFDNAEFAARFVHYGQRAVLAVGAEDQVQACIEAGGVGALADGGGRDHFPSIGVRDGHHLVIANGKETAGFGVHCEARWAVAGRQRISFGDRHSFRVDLDDFVGVFDIGVELAFAVGRRKLGLATERDGPFDSSGFRIDDRGIFGSAVESEDAAGDRFEGDRVGILAGLDDGDGFEGFQIEDGDRVRAAIAREAAIQIGRQRDAVHALRVRYVAHNGSGIHADNNGVRAMRNVKPARGAVHGHVIPAAFATDFDFLDDVVAIGGHRCRSQAEKRQHRFHLFTSF